MLAARMEEQVLNINLTDCTLRTGELNPAIKHARYAAIAVEHASGDLAYPLICRARFGKAECPGTVALGGDGREIVWRCTRCDDAGTIVGWSRSRWDLSRAATISDADHEPLTLFIPFDEICALRALTLPDAVRLGLAPGEQVGPRYVRARLAPGVLEVLAQQARTTANLAGGLEQRCLDRAVGRIEAALASASPGTHAG